ncbi:CPBP family intramembrane glutamic endopeptidase, partial [Staphylococcus succinus]|uniref:CPBP family intramembrane glutamic endopeptidase n=1 Tax=Staphylococcus succinus TaxID=61015 RepID=UPI00115A13DE
LCRGILFNKLLEFYTPFKAAIISSVIFAFAHFINYFDSTSNIEVTSQIIYAFFLGVFFAAIYYFTQNIWSVMLLHGLIDIVSGLTESNDLNMDLASTIVSSLIAIILVSPAFFIGKKMFRLNN